MLKITVKNGSHPPMLKLEGRLAGPWVDELLQAWNQLRVRKPKEPVTLDLSEVTFIDEDGKTILGWMFRKGAKPENARLLTKYIVDQVEHAPDSADPGGD